MRKLTLIIFFFSLLQSCNNIDSEEPSPLNSFIRFYEGPYSMSARAFEKIPGGFVILATMSSGTISDPIIQTVLIETDESGVRKGEYKIYDNIIGKSFKPIIKNGVTEGYIVIGDHIVIDPLAEQAANVSISSMEILILSSSFDEVVRRSLSDKQSISDSHPVKDDYYGGTITVTETGKVILLGTFKKGIINQQSAPEEQLLFGLDSSLDSAWVKFFPLLGNTFVNSKSIHSINGNIIWASAVADIQGDFTSSYIAIPFVPENSFPSNYSMTGQNTQQLYLPSDIQPSMALSGFGVTGTYSSNIDGSSGNVFFFKVDIHGNILPGTERFFDGTSALTDKNTSTVIDNGQTLTGTSDGGFVLAGTLTNLETKDKDILLIKVDAFGDKQWIKTTGASGDEQPVGIKEGPDGEIIVFGTNSLGGYSSVFLMKMDKDGELKN